MTTYNQSFIQKFFAQEAASGILLVCAAVLAITLANSAFSGLYTDLINIPVSVQVGAFEIAKPLLLWVNDGLMAVFFFLVGLELKREYLEGELSDPRNVVLPALGALGGMAIPALVYVALNYDDPTALRGWAIPAATDIAFALGVLALLGSRVPLSLKVFLTSLAIFDDVGAIIIIALFYTSEISLAALIVVAVSLVALLILNKRGYTGKSIYMVIGIVMWVATLKSGVHATLAGIALAFFIPMQDKDNPDVSPLKTLEHDLHTTVAFVILPIFAFFNAGIGLQGVGLAEIQHSVPMGIALGLFLGKQIGVFSLCWIGIKMGIARLPADISMPQLYGASVLTGIGFTMSLFISSLAFDGAPGVGHPFDERLGIIIGSVAAGIVGYLILRFVPSSSFNEAQNQSAK